MPFLAATTFLLYAHMIATFRALTDRNGARRLGAVLHWIATTVGACAVIFGFGMESVFTGARQPSMNLSVPLFFAFGLMTVILFGAKLMSARHQVADGAAFRLGMIVWAAVAGVYLAGTTVDHWMFFRDRENSGIADVRALGGEDVPCQGYALVRVDGEMARYRCPTSLVWGGMLSEWPFSPWPNYQAGESRKLAQGIQALHRNAVGVR